MMDVPGSMIVPDEEAQAPIICGRCWSEKMRFYVTNYQGMLMVLSECLHCGQRGMAPAEQIDITRTSENG
jgi:hypothetical protein